MNKQIQELIKQCTTYYNGGLGTEIEVFDKEKFARLIVQECASVLLKWKGEPFPFDEDLAASLIKEHFGVE
jgi:hypothetical protein